MPVRDGVLGSEQSTPAGPAADTSPMLRCRRRGHRPVRLPARMDDVPGRSRVCSTLAAGAVEGRSRLFAGRDNHQPMTATLLCFAKLKRRRTKEGSELAPDLPGVDGYGVLAGGGDAGAWTLCRVHVKNPRRGSTRIRTASAELADLIASCSDCPAPIALASRALRQLPGVHRDLAQFQTYLCKLLRHFLVLRRKGAFIAAKSKRDELGYREKGDIVWLVRKDGANVTWASSDAQLYSDLADEFALSARQLARLPDRVALPRWFLDARASAASKPQRTGGSRRPTMHVRKARRATASR